MNAPELDARSGDVRVAPLLSLLLRILEERWDGSLLVHGHEDAPLAVIRFQAGIGVAGRIDGALGTLAQRLLPICARSDARLVLVDGADLVGDGPGVAIGAVDPLSLLSAAMRGPLCDDQVVDRTIAAIGQDLLKLRPGTELDRYGFDPRELQALSWLEHTPMSFEQLREHAPLPEQLLRRVVYVLVATRGLTLVPAWRRIHSGAIMHAPPFSRPPALRDDEPTVVAPLGGTGTRQYASISHPAGPPSANSQPAPPQSAPPRTAPPCAEAQASLSRLRSARPTGSMPPAVPYRVRPDRAAADVVEPTLRPRAARATISSFAPPAIDEAARAAADSHFTTARLLSERGHHRAAVLEAQKALRLAPPRPEQRALYAWLLYCRGGNPTDVHAHVWEHLDCALHVDPNCAPAHRYKGMLLRRTGQFAEARPHLLRALQLDVDSAEAEHELRLLEHELPGAR